MNHQAISNDHLQGISELEELYIRYSKLYLWAKEQKFTTVYRAEWPHDTQTKRSWNNQHLVWTWYTDRIWLITSRYQREIFHVTGVAAKVYALIIPKSSLDERDSMDKWFNQINIHNIELREGREEITWNFSQAKEANLKNYLLQFKFINRYIELGWTMDI